MKAGFGRETSAVLLCEGWLRLRNVRRFHFLNVLVTGSAENVWFEFYWVKFGSGRETAAIILHVHK